MQRDWMSYRIQSELWVTGGLSLHGWKRPSFPSSAPQLRQLSQVESVFFDHGSSGGEVWGVKSSGRSWGWLLVSCVLLSPSPLSFLFGQSPEEARNRPKMRSTRKGSDPITGKDRRISKSAGVTIPAPTREGRQDCFMSGIPCRFLPVFFLDVRCSWTLVPCIRSHESAGHMVVFVVTGLLIGDRRSPRGDSTGGCDRLPPPPFIVSRHADRSRTS